MITIVKLFLVFSVIYPIGDCYAGWFGPSTYEECILDKMKEAKSNYAAAYIAAACRKKFPIEQQAVQWLPRDAVGRIRLVCNEREFDAYFSAQSELHRQQIGTDTTPRTGTFDSYLKQYQLEGTFRPEAITCALHNGNDKWTVTRMTVRVTDINSGNQFDSNVSLSAGMGSYGVPPLQNASYQMDGEPININSSIVTGKFGLSIISAAGFIQ
jgi:hypothetical protein